MIERFLTQVGEEFFHEAVFRLVAGEALDGLTGLEEHQGWDAHDLVIHRELGVVVDVQLEDGDFASPIVGELPDDRVEHLARLAPGGREIDQDGSCSLKHFLFEGRIRWFSEYLPRGSPFPGIRYVYLSPFTW